MNLARVAEPPHLRTAIMAYTTSNGIVEPAAQAGVSWFYRLNSVYDPDASGVGSSAIPYATYAGLFLNYRVLRVTIRVQGTITLAGGNGWGNVVVAPVAKQAVVPTNPNTWAVMPHAIVRAVAPNANGGPTIFSITKTFNNWDVARISRREYITDMDWSGSVGANPALQNYVMVSVGGVGSGVTASMFYKVQISYEVEWFNPVPLQ